MKLVLICDDDAQMRELIRLGLSKSPVEVIETATLMELYRTIESGIAYDVLVLDGDLSPGTTLPFFANLNAGAYPQLNRSTLILTTSNDGLLKAQLSYLEGPPAGASWRVVELSKAKLYSGLRELIT